MARHRLKADALRAQSEKDGKVFLHLNAGGMLGGNIWFPILGSQPAADSIEMLKFNAVVCNAVAGQVSSNNLPFFF